MSRMIFIVQPSSATISSFESVVKLECPQVCTESLRRVTERLPSASLAQQLTLRSQVEPLRSFPVPRSSGLGKVVKNVLVTEHVLCLDHFGTRNGSRSDDEEGRLDVLRLQEVEEPGRVRRGAVVYHKKRSDHVHVARLNVKTHQTKLPSLPSAGSR